MGWSVPRVGRKDNYAKSANVRVLRGRTAGSPRGEARPGCAARELNPMARHFEAWDITHTCLKADRLTGYKADITNLEPVHVA